MMRQTKVELTREELYQKVWATPISRLAKEFGLSDVGLAKICRKMKIPRPPRGYWAKLEAGHKVSKTPLPRWTVGAEKKVSITVREVTTPAPAQAALQPAQEDVERGIRFERDPRNRIRVGNRASWREQIVQTEERFAHARKSEWGLLTPQAQYTFAIHVSKDCLERSLNIMSALLEALERRGLKVYPSRQQQHTTVVEILDQTFKVRLFEATRYELLPLNHKQLAALERSGRIFGREHRYVPTGHLVLSIEGLERSGLRRNWQDTQALRLEERLNEFVIGLYKAVRYRRNKLLVDQIAQRQRQEEAQRREEARRVWEHKHELIREEKARIGQLHEQANAWHESQRLRAYIQAVAEGPDGQSEATRTWVAWATSVADRLDPLAPTPPSILDEEEKLGKYF